MEALAPTAQRLLAAARRLLGGGGFEALKLSAIAREAGEAKASIGYHFGNKDGLVTALVDSLAHDANRGAHQGDRRACRRAHGRVHALIDGEARIVGRRRVLPVLLRDPAARAARPGPARSRGRALRRLPRDGAALLRRGDAGRRAAELRPFAVLMIAIVDGLAIQHGLDPEGADVGAAIKLWERLVRPLLSGETR